MIDAKHRVTFRVASGISSLLLQESWDIENALAREAEDREDDLDADKFGRINKHKSVLASEESWNWYREKLSLCLAPLGWTVEELDREEDRAMKDFYEEINRDDDEESTDIHGGYEIIHDEFEEPEEIDETHLY